MEGLMSSYLELCDRLVAEIAALPLDNRVEALNQVRWQLHQISPFRAEPVDCVLWVKAENITANDYNPNHVAKPEMHLLEHSMSEYGIGFPLITYPQTHEPSPCTLQRIVDGFHRSRVGQTCRALARRLHGYLPVAWIKGSPDDDNRYMAATVAYNRARGQHQTELMGVLVARMLEQGCTDTQIASTLGMQAEEVLRLKQTTGLANLFAHESYGRSWVAGSTEGT